MHLDYLKKIVQIKLINVNNSFRLDVCISPSEYNLSKYSKKLFMFNHLMTLMYNSAIIWPTVSF